MMNRVTSINRNMYLGGFCDSQNTKRIPDELLFAAGVLSTMGLPQLILSVYGGTATLVVLAGITLLGSMAGLVVYRYLPYRMPRCIDAEINAQSPPSKNSTLRRAA